MTQMTLSRATLERPISAITTPATTTRLSGTVLAAGRVVIGFLFACHGAQKLFGVLGGTTASFGAWPGWWAGVIELVAGGMIMLGLFTRPAAILCSGTMAYAYFTVHQASGAVPILNHGELAALYAWTFLIIAIVGPGSLAIDSVLKRRRASVSRPASSR